MVMVKIFNIDAVHKEVPLTILNDGEHILGRGSFSNCTDRRISRKHAILKVEDESATLTSVHVNPCYYISEESTKVQILTKDLPRKLSDGDKFAFLPDSWYRIQIVKRELEPNMNNNSNSTITNPIKESTLTLLASSSKISDTASPLKRSLQELNSEGRKKLKTINQSLDQLLQNIKQIETQDFTKENKESKKQMAVVADNTDDVFRKKDLSDSDESVDTAEVTRDTEVVISEAIRRESVSDVEDLQNAGSVGSDDKEEEVGSINVMATVIEEPLNETVESPEQVVQSSHPLDENEGTLEPKMNGNQSDTEAAMSNDEENKETVQEIDDLASASSTGDTKLRREQCWYGGSCYRKNVNHRDEFSHPGDPDYDRGPDDDRPECSYGSQCYRTNQEHRRQYKHPTSRPATKQSTTGAKRKRTTGTTYEDATSDSETSQEDEPFSCDDSSSENYDMNDTDSDYSDSQAVDDLENSEEVRTMFKEAKKFLRGKRKDSE